MRITAFAISCFATLFSQTIGPTPLKAAESERPNIVLILADDLAWADTGVAGHPWHHTPNIDRFANSGINFLHGYAPAPICSASRASIMTGKTTARLGFEFVTKNEAGKQQIDMETPLETPAFKLNLPLTENTIPERLRTLGYQTAFFGKWHLNAHYGHYLGWSPTHGPRQHGFQTAVEDFGAHPYSWKSDPQPPIDEPGKFAADSMVDRVCDYVRQDHESPYFLFASSFYVHTPVRTPCNWLLSKYEAQVPANARNRKRRIEYAAFVETLDHHVGKILNAIDESGDRDETLVVFTSDNGGHPEYTANGPLRGSKWNLYEGGIRVPFIARWPGVTPESTICRQAVIGYDLLPTFVNVAGGEAGDVDGVSITNLLRDPGASVQRSIIWHFPYYHPEKGFAGAIEMIGVDDFAVSKTRPQSALRQGAYKLIHFPEDDRVELYDVNSDIAEQRDLSDQNPELAAGLRKQLEHQLNEMNARRAIPRAR